jgi:hypothetical protein
MTPDWPGDTAPLPHAVAEDRLAVRLAGMVGKRPCDGRNVNVCVAEGCYGEACIRDVTSCNVACAGPCRCGEDVRAESATEGEA